MNPTVNAFMYPDSKNGNSFADGLEFQDFVVEQFNKWGFYIQLHSSKLYQFTRGESVQRAEIKLDKRCIETGRLSIEVGERTGVKKAWVPSGIYRDDKTAFYVQGCHEVLYMFDKKVLIRYHDYWHKAAFYESPQPNPTIRKFYLPFRVADQNCIIKLTPSHAEE